MATGGGENFNPAYEAFRKHSADLITVKFEGIQDRPPTTQLSHGAAVSMWAKKVQWISE